VVTRWCPIGRRQDGRWIRSPMVRKEPDPVLRTRVVW